MQTIIRRELVMDNSHSFLLSDLPISEGEKVTVIVMREDEIMPKKRFRKAYAHRFQTDTVELPRREDLHER